LPVIANQCAHWCYDQIMIEWISTALECDKMKHIVMITNDTTFAYNLRREVLAGFVGEGYRVTLVAEFLAHMEELEALGCNLINVQTGRHGTSIVQDLRLFMHYFRIFRSCRPDVVFTNNIKPNVYAGMACRLLKIPYIPNITGLGTPVENPGPLQKLTTFLYRIGVGGAAAVLFQNEENLRFFRERKMLSPKSRAVLLPGSGVNLETHPLMTYPNEGKTHFLFVARVMKEKGIDLFLAAARKFHSESNIFEVVGGCDDENYLKILKEAQEQGIIVYHGLQRDVTPFYERCGCFLYPSYYPEGMSNVLLEAAACGRPVIAADRCGCRETVDDGISGYIVPVNDEEATLHAVEKFLNLTWEERKAMGLAGREKVEREFDRECVLQIYISEISALLCCDTSNVV